MNDRTRMALLVEPWRFAVSRSWPRPDRSDPASGVAVVGDAGDVDLRSLSASLHPTAIALVVAPRRRRVGLARRLRRLGLSAVADVVFVPSRRPDHLLSIGPELADGIDRTLGDRLPVVAARELARLRLGRTAIRLLAPAAGSVVVTRSRTSPVLAWAAGTGARPVRAHVSIGMRTDAPTATAMAYEVGRRSPHAVRKWAVSPAAHGRIRDEVSALRRVAVSARPAGIAVPEVLDASVAIDHGAGRFTMTGVPGRSLSGLVRRHPERMLQLVTPVVEAVGRWHRATWSAAVIDERFVQLVVHDPLVRIIGAVPALGRYASAVELLAESLRGEELPRVATHGDLTAANVVIDAAAAGRSIGFVDWESAAVDGLPLADAWYLLADAIATADASSHAQAVVGTAATSDGPTPAGRIVDRLADELGLVSGVRDLLYHLTWIAHAADEVDRGHLDGPFVEVLGALALPGGGPANRWIV